MQQLYLQLSLSNRAKTVVEGLSSPPITGAEGHLFVRAAFPIKAGTVYLFGQIYSPGTERGLRQWIDVFNPQDPGRWVAQCDGDFTAVVHDAADGRAWVLADRNGQQRVYLGVEEGILRVSNSLLDLASQMRQPRLSQEGVFHLLALKYSLDPVTLVEGVQATAPGTFFEVHTDRICQERYYSPVVSDCEYFPTMNACVTGLDDAFRSEFAKRYDPTRRCVVLLSGGIDSVAMLRYLTEVAPGKVEAFTFGLKGDEGGDEVRAAQMAARHFGVEHHLHFLDPVGVARQVPASFREADGPHYGAAMWFSMRSAVFGVSGPSDLYTGQDTRLHTPSFDAPKALGVRLSAAGNSLLNTGWRAALAATRLWPFRGKRTLAYWRQASYPQASVQDYILKSILNVPASCAGPYAEPLLRILPHISPTADVQEIFKAVIQFEYRTQFTDDMNAFCAAMRGPEVGIHFPFYDHDFVAACNRIPYGIGARHVFTTRSWSWIPFTQKAVLRKLLLMSIPEDLVYRRKATLPSIHHAFNMGVQGLVAAIYARWGGALLEALDEDNARWAQGIMKQALDCRFYRCPEEHDLAWDSYSVAYLTVLQQVISGNGNAMEELDGIASGDRRLNG